MSTNDKKDTDNSDTQNKPATIKQYVSRGVRDVDDTVRIATGFVMGGVTAAELSIGSIGVIIIAGLIVSAEVVYGFTSVWIEAWRLSKQKNSESK